MREPHARHYHIVNDNGATAARLIVDQFLQSDSVAESARSMALEPGTRLGVYEIRSALGAGGMGEVYRARDTRLQRDVALKILSEAFASDAGRYVSVSTPTTDTTAGLANELRVVINWHEELKRIAPMK